MEFKPKYPMQTGGQVCRWSNPDRTFHCSLVKMNLACEADPYPGILILTNLHHEMASALDVKNLRKELTKILEPLGEDTIAYWKIAKDEGERKGLLASLTQKPIFDDIHV